MASSGSGQISGVLRCVIGQRIGLQPGPGVLYRIEFRCVGRQELKTEPRLAGSKGPDYLGAMGIEPIPDHQNGPPDLPAQLPEKRRRSRTIHPVIEMETEAQPDPTARPVDDQRGDHREFLVVAGALPQNGSPAARTPRAPDQRRHQ